MKPANLLFILCDEHNPRLLGCADHPVIRTPNLDRVAAKGVRFSDAYCNSPICVPSRAALATGRCIHRIWFWDNAIPYDGSVPSWHHRVRDNDFTREIMPLHGTIVVSP
jgi:choline-sulfatase